MIDDGYVVREYSKFTGMGPRKARVLQKYLTLHVLYENVAQGPLTQFLALICPKCPRISRNHQISEWKFCVVFSFTPNYLNKYAFLCVRMLMEMMYYPFLRIFSISFTGKLKTFDACCSIF